MQELPQFLAEIFPGKTYDSLRNIYGFASKVNCNNLTLKYNKTNNKGMSVNKITCKSFKKRLDFEKLHLLPKKYFIPNYKYFYTDIFVRSVTFCNSVIRNVWLALWRGWSASVRQVTQGGASLGDLHFAQLLLLLIWSIGHFLPHRHLARHVDGCDDGAGIDDDREAGRQEAGREHEVRMTNKLHWCWFGAELAGHFLLKASCMSFTHWGFWNDHQGWFYKWQSEV